MKKVNIKIGFDNTSYYLVKSVNEFDIGERSLRILSGAICGLVANVLDCSFEGLGFNPSR